MVLEPDKIAELATSKPDTWIEQAREDNRLLRMHYYGDRSLLEEYLKKVDGLESDEELNLRKRYALSNRFITDNLLRPTDNIWNAKGGSAKFDVKGELDEKKIKERLSRVKGSLSLKRYLKERWFPNFVADPCGLTFVEVKDGESYLAQKSINSIKNMKLNGIRPEYVCFEPDVILLDVEEKQGKKVEHKKKYVWIVDDVYYYRVLVNEQQGLEPTVTIENKIPNSFKRVPAIVNSSIYDTDRKLNISPIWSQMELFGKYLRNGSIKEIYLAKHGYPVFWMYAPSCDTCKGTGAGAGGKSCTSCNGTGKSMRKDVSQAILLKHPTNDSTKVTPDVAGYVQPGIETWQEQTKEQDWTWDLIFYSHWGTTEQRTKKGESETATGRFIDSQAVSHRLNAYADIVEDVENELADLILKNAFKESFEGSHITTGRRFIVEKPDELWAKYLTAKEKKAPDVSLDHLLIQYYESEFNRDSLQLEYYLKLMKVEPFVHHSIEEVLLMPIGENDKKNKVYFGEWKANKLDIQIIDQSVEVLKNDLNNYVQQKQLENGNTGNGSSEG